MPITLTSTIGSLPAPAAALETSNDRTAQSNTQVHELLDGGVAFTLRQARSATGTIVLLYTSRADAETVFAALCGPSTFTYTNTAPARTFSFVVIGTPAIKQAVIGNVESWVLTVEFRELT